MEEQEMGGIDQSFEIVCCKKGREKGVVRKGKCMLVKFFYIESFLPTRMLMGMLQ